MNEKEILLVDDDEGHVYLLKVRLKRLGLKNNIHWVKNGQEALTYLRQSDTELPAIMLLDLNMPVLSGLQVLEEIAKDDTLNKIPRIILTTSDDADDLQEVNRYGVEGYMIKPINYTSLAERIDDLLNHR